MIAGLLVTVALAAPNSRDEALFAMAGGDPKRAASLIGALDRGADPELGCLLGRARLQAGDLDGAAAALAAVPPAAACAGSATFLRAEVLSRKGERAAAAALFAAAAAPRMGPTRDEPFAAWAQAMVDRLLADPDGDIDQAGAILGLLLNLQLSPARRDGLALFAAETGAQLRDSGRSPTFVAEDAVAQALRGLLLRDEAPYDARHRLALADVSDGPRALLLLDGLPDSPALQATRLRALLRGHADAGAVLREALRSRPAVARAAARAYLTDRFDPYDQRWVALLDALDDAEEAGRRAIALAEARGAWGEAADRAADWLRRFPAGEDREAIEQSIPRLRLDAARASADPALLEALVEAHPASPEAPQALYEAGLRRLAADPAQARARWQAVMARYPQSEAAIASLEALARHLVAQGRAEEATAFLRGLEARGPFAGAALAERARMNSVDLALAVEGRQGKVATVALRVRNLETVELRLHRIDPAAFLRAGRGPADLADLDVGVIAPDKRWTVAIPGALPQRDQLVHLPVALPGPGYYALTAAGPDREARAILLASDLDLVARAVGDDLVLAVLRDGVGVPRAQISVFGARGVVEGRTDRSGLWTGRAPTGPLRVLALDGDAPAMAALDGVARGLVRPVETTLAVDLDRGAIGPDDTLGLRLVGRRGGAPLRGRYLLWLEDNAKGPITAVEASALGTVTAALRAPALAGGELNLYVQAPGERPRVLARVRVVGEVRPGRLLEATLDGGQGAAHLTEADGRPVAGAPLRWTWTGGPATAGATDADGRLRPAALPAALPEGAEVTLAGGLTVAAEPVGLALPAPTLHPRRPTLRPGEALQVDLHSPVALPAGATLLLSRQRPAPTPPPPPADPFVPALPLGLEGPEAWSGPTPPPAGPALTAELARLPVPTAAGDHALSLPLPALEGDGPLFLTLVSPDGLAPLATAEARLAGKGARLGPVPAALAAGAPLRLGLEDGPSLLTVEQDGLRAAALLPAGGALPLLPTVDWQGEVALVRTDLEGGAEAVYRPVAGDLQVSLAVVDLGARWDIDLQVKDAAGRPVLAEVALGALDEALRDLVPAAPQATSALSTRKDPAASATALARRWRDGALASLLSGALLDEARRVEEAAIAALAARGELSRSRLGPVMEGDAIIMSEESFGGIGGIGTGGGGSGASGYGMGSGVMGKTAADRGPLPLSVERALWAVVSTDAQGVAHLNLPAPKRPSDYTVWASAVSLDSQGQDAVKVHTESPRLYLPPGGPLGPDDALQPTLALYAPGPAKGDLRVERCVDRLCDPNCVPAPITLAGGAVLAQALDGVGRAGQSARVVLRAGPALVGADLDYTAAAPPGQEAIPLGPDGRADLAALALRPDPALALGLRALPAPIAGAPPVDPLLRAARWGRSLVAALPAAADPAPLRAQILSLRFGIAQAGPAFDPEVVAFFVEADPIDPLPGRGLATLVEATKPTEEPLGRAITLWAQAAVGLPVEEASFGRYARERDTLDPVEAAYVGHALIALGRKDEARPFLEAPAALALADRARLGLPVDPALLLAGPPPTGAPERAAWVAAMAALRPVLGAPGMLRLLGAPTIEGELAATGLRLPQGPDGRLRGTHDLLSRARSGRLSSPGCVSGETCVIGVGEGLILAADLLRPGFVPPAGLSLVVEGVPRAPVLRATTPGIVTLRGLSGWAADGSPVALAPLRVEIRPLAPPPEPWSALADARVAAAAGADPRPFLDRLPPLRSLSAGERQEALLLRFRASLDAPPAELVARFEDLRDGHPAAALELDEVSAVAAAYAAIDKPDRSLAVLRAGLGAAFLAEAAPARQLEDITGPLSSLQALRALVGRYPDLPAVEEALFLAPARLGALAEGGLPEVLVAQGITPTDVRLLAAAWDREFLALYPQSPRVPAAAFDLVSGLLGLRAFDLAADQAARYAPLPSPLSDTLLFLEGVARAESGGDAAAARLFAQIATGDFPQEDGTLGPARTAADARYALARLDEARGRYEKAQAGYAAVQGDWPEAARSAAALGRVSLEVGTPVLRVKAGAPVSLPVLAVNIDEVRLQAYAIDLRTIFLRDAGLDGVQDISVAGISPAWTGSARLRAGPFPAASAVNLPLRGAGAWLVHIDGGGQHQSALVLRSDLSIDTSGGRVVVRQGRGSPAAGAQVRALLGGSLLARQTDLRGVVDLPPDAILLAWQGEDLAFSLPDRPVNLPAAPAAAPPVDLLRNVNERMLQQRLDNDSSYESTFQKSASGMVNAEAL